MTEHLLTRRSYEAAVLLVPFDGRARAALDGPAAAALDGITVAPPSDRSPDDLDEAASQADMVIVLSCDLSGADPAAVARLGAAARGGGATLGAIVVTPGRRWTEPAAQRGMVALREAADTVVVLGDLASAIAFVQVLRGGSRVAASPAGV